MDSFELKNLASSALEEALSFGLSRDLFERYFKQVIKATAPVESTALPLVMQAVRAQLTDDAQLGVRLPDPSECIEYSEVPDCVVTRQAAEIATLTAQLAEANTKIVGLTEVCQSHFDAAMRNGHALVAAERRLAKRLVTQLR